MTASTRLFRSPWPYFAGLALFVFDIWHDLRPRPHPVMPAWHPLYSAIVSTLAEIFCIFLAFSFARLTSNALERAALALFTLELLPSIVSNLHALGAFHTALPSFRLVFLTINTVLAILMSIRFIQVLRHPLAEDDRCPPGD